jgi:3',5'-cyclic AMP phosphodiesterase CpdA
MSSPSLGAADVTVIPGNHDAYVAEGVGHFLSTFADYCRTDPGWEWPLDGSGDGALQWPIVRVRGELAIVGLSTSRATPWFTAYGRVGEVQLQRLRSALADPRLRGKVRIVAIHHPPAGDRARSRIRGLRDHQAFAAALAEVGADLVIHGHEHVDVRESLPDPQARPISVLGVPSGTYEAGRPHRTARVRIIELENGRIIGHHLRVWHRARRTFERDEHEPAMSAKSG